MTTPWFADVHVTDVGRVDAQLPQTVHLDHVPTAPFAFHTHRVTRGPLGVEETRGTDGIHLRLPDRPSYQVGLPVRGPLHADHRGKELDLVPGRAAVFSPWPETTVVTGDRFDMLLVDVGSAALEDMLEALLGRTVPRPLRLLTSMTVGTAAGRTWAGTVRLIADATTDTSSVLANPMSAEPLQDTLLVRLLLAADHPHREALDERVPTWGPGPCADVSSTSRTIRSAR
jgi:hypothetical protein